MSDYDPSDSDFERRYSPTPRTGKGLTSLILGICAVVTSPASMCCLPVGMICGIIGIVFGCLSLNTEGRGMGIAGLILSIVGALASVVLMATYFAYALTANGGPFRGMGWTPKFG